MSDLIRVGLDIGYAFTKVVSSKAPPFFFPSVTGTVDRAKFSVEGDKTTAVIVDEEEFFVGESAVVFSGVDTRLEERTWINTPNYKAILHVALSQITAMQNPTAAVVTGLPISYFSDKDKLTEIIAGEHRIKRHGRPEQIFNIERVIVIPQGMGVAVDSALSEDAQEIKDPLVADGDVGVIDIGGKTTNFQLVHQMSDVSSRTFSMEIGSWDVVRAMRETVANLCPDAKYRDHELAEAISAGEIKYSGRKISVRDEVRNVASEMASGIISRASQAFDNFTKLDAVIIAGGGATVFGDILVARIPHDEVRVAINPMFSNVNGYYKVALRIK